MEVQETMTRYSQAVPLENGTQQESLRGISSNVVDREGDSWEAHDDLGMGIRFMRGVVIGILLSSPIWALILWALR